ncbi:MAG: acyl-[ACP]--phospholipid O-acyltransferase [Pseudobdellovibrionaceae bacterium]
MSDGQFSLLKKRNFLPLFITQFLGAFHDNLFKNALVVLIIYQLAQQLDFTEKAQQLLTTLAAGILILPFFLFSAMGGQLADKFPKDKIMRAVKLFEILIALLGFAALLSANLYLCYATLFALGTHSAIFSPSKYSILPQHLDRGYLIAGNALLNTGTFLAILLGTIIGTSVMALHSGALMIGSLMISISLIGYAASRYIPLAPPASENAPFSLNPFRETWDVMAHTFRQPREIRLSLLGKGWFFCIGSMFMAQFANYTKGTLGADEHVLTLFLVLFSVGIAIGGLFNHKLLRGTISAVFVPLSALGLSLFSIDIYFASSGLAPRADGTFLSVSEFLQSFAHARIVFDVFMVAFFGGLFVIPLSAIIQDRTPPVTRARVMAGSSITDSMFMVASAVVSALLIGKGYAIRDIFLFFALANLGVTLFICRLLPDYLFKTVLQIIFKILYKVEVRGLEHIEAAGPRAVIVGNHVSLLDPPLLAAFLPGRPMFAVNSFVANWWWVRPFLKLVDAFPLDPTNPYSLKALIRKVEENRHIVIFPEGRLTDTGALMKVYDGPGMIADKTGAVILPVRLDGVQHTPFARLKGKVPLKSFPKITITVLPPVTFTIDPDIKGRARRVAASQQLYDVMESMMFETSDRDQNLWNALLKARYVNGDSHIAAEDPSFVPLTYRNLIRGAYVLGHKLRPLTQRGEIVGLMLPNSAGAILTFFALQVGGQVPAMVNYSAGLKSISSSLSTSGVKTVITSRRFVELGKLDELVNALSPSFQILYLEDLKAGIGLLDKARALLFATQPSAVSPESPAVVLFTSGSEGSPKGVVLSHRNIMSNIVQLATRVDFNQQDLVFNALPMFHSFGLTAGALLPVLSGIRTFLYPNPIHYRIVPEMVYATNATIMFGTDTFLTGYARMASSYDFYRMRYIFAGAEKVKDSTRQLYADKFGVRILEGYGATETAPVIAVNSAMHQKNGTVGRILPGITARLETVPGISEGGRLFVKGPNVMLGYFRDTNPGVLEPPHEGWHDTGDIVSVDHEGFVRICGRAKRFAKIGGEMVSLTLAESLAQKIWPDFQHAVIVRPNPRKGETLILITTAPSAARENMIQLAQELGITALAVPSSVLVRDKLPVLGSGKVDYASLESLLEASLDSPPRAPQ